MKYHQTTLCIGLLATGMIAFGSVQAQAPMNGMGMKATVPMLPSAEDRLLRGMNDANILGHLAATDSFEVLLADTAIMNSKSDAILAYAKSMREEHLSSMNAVKQIGHDSRLGLTVMVGELKRTHVFSAGDSVSNASDFAIDRHYTMGQVQFHQHMVAELQTLQSVAQNQRLREHLALAMTEERDDLAKAHALAASKGYEKKRMGS